MFEIVLFELKDVSKLFKESLVQIDCGSALHNFEAEYEKERSFFV